MTDKLYQLLDKEQAALFLGTGQKVCLEFLNCFNRLGNFVSVSPNIAWTGSAHFSKLYFIYIFSYKYPFIGNLKKGKVCILSASAYRQFGFSLFLNFYLQLFLVGSMACTNHASNTSLIQKLTDFFL